MQHWGAIAWAAIVWVHLVLWSSSPSCASPASVVSIDEAVVLAQQWLAEDPDPHHHGPLSNRAR